MGHYYSEMGYEERDREIERRKQEDLNRLAERVEIAIHEEGLPMVLAKIIEGSKRFGNHYPPEFWEYRDDT